MESQYISSDPALYAVVTIVIFWFVSGVLFLYDYIVRMRQEKIMSAASRTNQIVANLFPKDFRERLYEQQAELSPASLDDDQTGRKSFSGTSRMQMQTIAQTASARGTLFASEPLADLFPNATVCVINVANFSAWYVLLLSSSPARYVM